MSGNSEALVASVYDFVSVGHFDLVWSVVMKLQLFFIGRSPSPRKAGKGFGEGPVDPNCSWGAMFFFEGFPSVLLKFLCFLEFLLLVQKPRKFNFRISQKC